MRITQNVKKVPDWYEGGPPGRNSNSARILCTGGLAGTWEGGFIRLLRRL